MTIDDQDAHHEADRPRRRRVHPAQERRPGEAAEVPGHQPADGDQQDRGDRLQPGLVSPAAVVMALLEVREVAEDLPVMAPEDDDRDEQRHEHDRLAPGPLDRAYAEVDRQPRGLPGLAAGLEHPVGHPDGLGGFELPGHTFLIAGGDEVWLKACRGGCPGVSSPVTRRTARACSDSGAGGAGGSGARHAGRDHAPTATDRARATGPPAACARSPARTRHGDRGHDSEAPGRVGARPSSHSMNTCRTSPRRCSAIPVT